MTTFLYASILAIWLCWLVVNIVKVRRLHQVKLGDGGVEALIEARSAHSNAVETIPITLILLFGLEYNGGPLLLVHLLGVVFVLGRVLHSKGILKGPFKFRVLGMKMTLGVIVALVMANMIYLPYAEMIKF